MTGLIKTVGTDDQRNSVGCLNCATLDKNETCEDSFPYQLSDSGSLSD